MIKKLILVCIFLGLGVQAFSEDNAAKKTGKFMTQTWDETKTSVGNAADKTGDALKTGWGWTKAKAIFIGHGFKEGAVTGYHHVFGPSDQSNDKQKKEKQASSDSNTQK